MTMNTDQSYVRTQMLSEKAPPVTNVGIIGWLRNNLFSSPMNIILSLLAIVAVFMVLSALLPWIFGGVWNAGSLSECRAVLLETHGEQTDRACWGVIHERFWQLMYGFYPSDLYWRPNLALIWLFAAIAPVLFNGLPKKMLVISAAFPFVAPWLLWGGAIWVPLMAFMGFVIGFLVHKFTARAAGSLTGIILGVLAAIIWWLFFSGMVASGISHAIGANRMPGEAARIEAAIPVQEAEVAKRLAVYEPLKAELTEIEAEIAAAVSAGGKEAGSPVSDLIRRKAPLKLAVGAASSNTIKAQEKLKGLKSELKAVNSLLQDEERLQGLETEADAARAGLPATVAGIENTTEMKAALANASMTDIEQLKADVVLLRPVLKLEEKRDTLDGAITELYENVGLVGLKPVGSRSFGGFMLAITLGITGIVLSFPIGIVLALGRLSDLVIVKALCVGFIEFIRGVPLITLLFVASVLLNYFLPKGTQFDIILRVMIMITLFSAAYMAEVIRGGLAALPKGQYEAADALGLDYWQAQRLIILPQALKISIPGIVSIFIGLFKDTTLVSIIALSDPIGWVKLIQGNTEWNGVIWELYGFVAFIFFLFCFSMSRYSMYLERKLQTGH